MAKLKIGDVKKMASLSRLTLSEKEEKKLLNQLSETITYVEQLDKLDTSDTSPTYHVTGLRNIFRDDKVTPGFSKDDAISQSKNTYNNYFKVNALLNKS